MFVPRNLQVARFLSCCDNDMAPFQPLIIYLKRGWASESSAAVECRDPGFPKLLFPVSGNRLRERALESHQFFPINANLLAPNPFSFHSAGPVNSFCSTDKNLFRVTSPDSPLSADKPRIQYFSPTRNKP